MSKDSSFILTLMCPDGVGIVAAATSVLAQRGALITEAQHYREPTFNKTVLRVVFEATDELPTDLETFKRAFEPTAARFGMTWDIVRAAVRSRVLVAVSKQGHCLKSILHRWEVGTLPVTSWASSPIMRPSGAWSNGMVYRITIFPLSPGAKRNRSENCSRCSVI